MGIGVLGPLAVGPGDGVSPRDRVVLEALVVRAGTVVDKEVLADALWGDSLPASWAKVVQGCVARLRRVLGAAAVETTPYGYRLLVHDDELDVRRFEVLVSRAGEQLDSGDADRASYLVGEALALWRGPAYPDLTDWEPGRNERERLEDLRLTAEELRVEAEIRAGRSSASLKDARSMVTEAPLRERRWALLARALYQAGRQSESLEVIGRARRMLRDELGLDPGPELVALEQAILRQDPDLAAADTQPASRHCPYRGLLPYEAEDADSFFGREADIGACLKLLRERGTLALVGPSGSGKSSLVRAGIVAALRKEGRHVTVTTPGHRPLDSLADLPRRGSSPVLVVDQAEEAVTLCANAEERASYFAALGGYAGQLIVALRADHLGDLAAYPAFARIIERGLHLLTGMDEQNLRAAIEGPARQAGLRLESGLSDLLVREVEGEPGALPLLSHVLRQTWENREGRTLTVDGYRRTGGVRNALAQSAEALYQGLAEPQRDQIRALFLRLVMPSTDGDPVRARVPRSKVALDVAHERLIEELIAARLVTSDDTEIQIAHEALAREWPRLQDWLAQDIEGQQIFRHLAMAAESWDRMRRPDSELYRGSRLAVALEWAERSGSELTEAERSFLAQSQACAEEEVRQTQLRLREKVRSNRRLRAALIAALLLLASAAVAGGLAARSAGRAQHEKNLADAATLSADARRLAALSLTSPDLATSALLAAASYRLQDTPDGRGALLSVLDHGRSALWRLGTSGKPTGLWATPDGHRLYASTDAGVEVIDPAQRKVMASYPPPENVDHIVGVTKGGSEMVRLGYLPKPNGDQLPRLSIADARAGKFRYYLPRGPISVAYDAPSLSPNGRWLAAALAPGGMSRALRWSSMTSATRRARHAPGRSRPAISSKSPQATGSCWRKRVTAPCTWLTRRRCA